MKRLWILFGVAAVLLCGSAAIASLYLWNGKQRPPISLREALDRAEKALGDDAKNRYCVSVSLYGNEAGDGKQGAWNLIYSAADGSEKYLYVDMNGTTELSKATGPFDWNWKATPCADLAEARRRIEEVFAGSGIKADIAVADGRVTASFRTRVFQVYPELDKGGFGKELQPMTGPEVDGLWMQVWVVEHPDWHKYRFFQSNYWGWDRSTYQMKQPGKYLAVDLRSGTRCPDKVSARLLQACGDRVLDPPPPGGFGPPDAFR